MSGVWQRGSEELPHDLRELETRMRRDNATALGLIAELDQRNAAADCGYPSFAALLRDMLRISLGEANRRIRHAHAVTEVPLVSGGTVAAPLPATGAAARDGVLGPEHLEVISRSLTGLPLHVQPDAIADAEQTMVTAAASMDARTLARVGARVRAVLDQDGAPPNDAELANPVNELHLHTKTNGRTALRGELEPEASALLHELLSPLAKPRPTAQDGPDNAVWPNAKATPWSNCCTWPPAAPNCPPKPVRNHTYCSPCPSKRCAKASAPPSLIVPANWTPQPHAVLLVTARSCRWSSAPAPNHWTWAEPATPCPPHYAAR